MAGHKKHCPRAGATQQVAHTHPTPMQGWLNAAKQKVIWVEQQVPKMRTVLDGERCASQDGLQWCHRLTPRFCKMAGKIQERKENSTYPMGP